MTRATLELYVRAGCHLCDAFLLDLSLDHPGLLGALATRDVDTDAALATEFGLRVPVLAINGRVACEGRYDRDKVAAALGL
ncbi:MAG: glutaredoxin family protein [Steroidobacteraceae bacterium]